MIHVAKPGRVWRAARSPRPRDAALAFEPLDEVALRGMLDQMLLYRVTRGERPQPLDDLVQGGSTRVSASSLNCRHVGHVSALDAADPGDVLVTSGARGPACWRSASTSPIGEPTSPSRRLVALPVDGGAGLSIPIARARRTRARRTVHH